jgi:hypothetical protein
MVYNAYFYVPLIQTCQKSVLVCMLTHTEFTKFCSNPPYSLLKYYSPNMLTFWSDSCPVVEGMFCGKFEETHKQKH